MALVFFGRRSRGLYFFLRYSFLRLSRWLWLTTVSTRAIDFLTTLLYGGRGGKFKQVNSISSNNNYAKDSTANFTIILLPQWNPS